LVARGPEVMGREFTKEQIENYLARLGKKDDIRAEQLTLRDFLELYNLTRD
jgi:16S rRNA A1518/A1519 N6-dimethyltransferase RsmA/KsgA/DIM1 with predicted DNA glycosylase/AP lyase activity